MQGLLERELKRGMVVFDDLLAPTKAGSLDPFPITLKNLNHMLSQSVVGAQRQHAALGRRGAELRREGQQEEALAAVHAQQLVGRALLFMEKAVGLLGQAQSHVDG